MNTGNQSQAGVAAPAGAPVMMDLVAEIDKILVEARHPNPQFWKHQLHPHAYTSEDWKVRRFLINRQWQMIFGSVPPSIVPPSYAGDSLDARFCMLENGDVADWLKSFREGVVPKLFKYNIPAIVQKVLEPAAEPA